MTGFRTIKLIQDFERRAADMGFVIQAPKDHCYQSASTRSMYSTWIDEVSSDNISLVPAEGRYPGWGNRGTEIFTGTIEEGKLFLQGVEFAHISDATINLTSVKKRLAHEYKVVERMRRQEEARIKKEEQKKVWSILQHGKEVEDDGRDEVPF